MSLYFDNKSTERLVKRHGINLTIEKPTRSAYDPVTGKTSTTATPTVTVRGFISVSRPDTIEFTSAPVGDRRVWLLPYDTNGNPYSVSTNDVIVDPVTNKRLAINRVQDYRSNGDLLMNQLLLDE
jgi:hypothetical protein